MRAILMYHSIDKSGSPISVSPWTFRAHCAFLASGRVSAVPLRDIVGSAGDTDRIAITFDDGFSNFEETALPVLEEFGLPATVFVVSDHVGAMNDWSGKPARGIPALPLMGWDAIARTAQKGVSVGAHTRRHPDLTALPPSALEDEIAGCAETMRAELGRKPDSFAYPYGRVNPAAAIVARDVFAVSCTTELRLLAATEDRALLPRLDAYYLRGIGQLEAWGSAGFRRRLWLRARGRRVRQFVDASALMP